MRNVERVTKQHFEDIRSEYTVKIGKINNQLKQMHDEKKIKGGFLGISMDKSEYKKKKKNLMIEKLDYEHKCNDTFSDEVLAIA